jgi:hypothetical protein
MNTYDAKKVIIVFRGRQLTGFPDGTFVTVSPSSDTFTKKVGADGEVARSRTNDDTSEVTITHMQTSASNAYLNTIKEEDRLFGTAIGPLSITDLSGTALHFWPEAWIKKSPGGEFGQEVGERAWVFDTGQPTEDKV